MTPQDRLAVLQAAIDGKALQCRPAYSDGSWMDITSDRTDGALDFKNFHYRVKRVPRSWFLIIRKNGEVARAETDRESAKKSAAIWGAEPLNRESAPYTVVEVKEVLGDEGA